MATGRTILVGTTKGAFLLDDTGSGWQVSGPFCDGWPVNHVIGDGKGRLWAAGGSDWHGPGIWRSDDGGQSWALSAEGLEGVAAMWSLRLVGRRLLAGAKPATLFESHDGGATWTVVQGLSDHPSGPGWEPGAAGLTLHSIVDDPADPARLWVGISAAGVFATTDGGATWDRRNRRANAATSAEGETGLCVHNLARAPGRPVT